MVIFNSYVKLPEFLIGGLEHLDYFFHILGMSCLPKMVIFNRQLLVYQTVTPLGNQREIFHPSPGDLGSLQSGRAATRSPMDAGETRPRGQRIGL
jgi:hypothetical protein